ncbi:MAG: hypothetical protein WAS55_11180 [Saprospiraceae bacterium]
MSGSQVFVYLFFGILVLASLIVSWVFTSRATRESKTALKEKEELKILYDQIRKDKFELEEKINQAQGHERTYKVAYEDWKSKYSLLEENYLKLKKDQDIKSPEFIHELEILQKERNHLEIKNTAQFEKIQELEILLSNLRSSKHSDNTSNDTKIVAELKSVLDQHLAIISNIIGDEKMEQYTQKAIPADPLNLIKGIDDEIAYKLQTKGIRSFEQIMQTSKRDLKKWMLEFEDIDDKIIESWPYQAEAILNVKSLNAKAEIA